MSQIEQSNSSEDSIPVAVTDDARQNVSHSDGTAAGETPRRSYFDDPFDYEVDAALFARVMTFVSSEETRYYLHGVCIEPCAPEEGRPGARLIATDGRRLCVAYDESAVCRLTEPVIVKANGDLLKVARKRDIMPMRLGVHNGFPAKRFSAVILFQGMQKQEGEAVAGMLPVMAEFDAVIDGTFPDWRHLFDKETMRRRSAGGAPMCVDHSYLASFAAISDRSRPKLYFFPDTDKTAPIVVASEDKRFVGFLMPMRSDLSEWTPPDWLALDALAASEAGDQPVEAEGDTPSGSEG